MEWLDEAIYEIFCGMPPHDKIRTMYEFLHLADPGEEPSFVPPAVGDVDMIVFTYFVGGKTFVMFKDVTDRYLVVFGRSQRVVSRIAAQFALAGYLLLRSDAALASMTAKLRAEFLDAQGLKHRSHDAYLIVGKVEPVCMS